MNKMKDKTTRLLEQYKMLNLNQDIDWEKFNHYAIVHHSTSIEGASLSVHETIVLLDEGITAKGKPLMHHLMQTDHYKSLLFTLDAADKKQTMSPELIKQIAALVMQSTGSVHHTALGAFDSSQGDVRLLNVHAGETRFVDFTKVPDLVRLFCEELNQFMRDPHELMDCLQVSFDAHFNLVSIHPFADGNGRVSRLIMNYIQHFYRLPLAIVFKEDKAAYYKALTDSREKEDMDIFRQFMYKQYEKMLLLEISKAKKSKTATIKPGETGKGGGLSMIF
jgi:Fic family protein